MPYLSVISTCWCVRWVPISIHGKQHFFDGGWHYFPWMLLNSILATDVGIVSPTCWAKLLCYHHHPSSWKADSVGCVRYKILNFTIHIKGNNLTDLIDEAVSQPDDCGDEKQSSKRGCCGNGRPWCYVSVVSTQGRDTQSSCADTDWNTPGSTTANTHMHV